MNDFRDFMMDLETVGKRPGCAILSIGIVPFNIMDDIVGTGMEVHIGLADNVRLGLELDPETMEEFWFKPEHNAALNAVWVPALRSPNTVYEACEAVGQFVAAHGGLTRADSIKMWGNGANFDQPIFNVAAARAGWKNNIWKFWNEPCYRTMKDWLKTEMAAAGTYPTVQPAALKHCAVADADFQARQLVAAMRKFRGHESRYAVVPETKERPTGSFRAMLSGEDATATDPAK